MSQTTPADFAALEVDNPTILPAGFPVGEASDAGLQSVLERPVPPGADSSSGVIAPDDFEVGEQTNYSANITPVSDAEFDAIESMFTRMDNFQEYGPFRKGTGLKLEGDGTSFSVLKPWENPNFDYTASLVTGTASPVVGNPNAGIWKRLDNTLTGGLFLNNNSVVDQADTEAYSNTPLFGIDGVTHGDVYDASVTAAEYLGYAELGLAVGSLKAFVRNLDADNAKYAADSSGPGNQGLIGASDDAAAFFSGSISPRTQGILDRFDNARRVDIHDPVAGEVIPVQVVEGLTRRQVKVSDLGKLQDATGSEFSLLRGPSGERVLIQGTVNRTAIPQSYVDQGYKWSGHSHPYSAVASPEDRAVLRALGQESSVIRSSATGEARQFFQFEDLSNWLPGQ
ncbi:MAG: hypothetical protein AB2806_03765 [Candidatus Thiodiazotropha sp.]